MAQSSMVFGSLKRVSKSTTAKSISIISKIYIFSIINYVIFGIRIDIEKNLNAKQFAVIESVKAKKKFHCSFFARNELKRENV